MSAMGRLTPVLLLPALLLAGCSSTTEAEPTPAPTVTVTVTPAPATDERQRFRDDPKAAFVFASAYEIIWGSPIGNGENANEMVSAAAEACRLATRVESWDELTELLGGDENAEKLTVTAQVYCPEVEF